MFHVWRGAVLLISNKNITRNNTENIKNQYVFSTGPKITKQQHELIETIARNAHINFCPDNVFRPFYQNKTAAYVK